MYRCTMIPVIHLQLFSDGGAAGGNGAGEGTGTGVNAPAAGVQSGVKDTQSAGNAAAEGASTAEVSKTDTKPDRNADYQRLIKGDYKDLYDADVQKIVQRRLRGPAADAAKYRELGPTMELLAKHYGVEDPTDIKALNAAIEADDTFIERQAMEKGMSPDEYRKFRRLEQQNSQLIRQVEERKRQDAMAQQYGQWKQQAEQAKKLYPSLDLDHEMQNQDFMKLIQSGVDVRAAYQVVHSDEIYTGLLRHATEQASQKVAASVAANGARPAENGSGAQSPATVKIDPSKMTREQRRALNQRVARGEKISF